MGKIIKLKESDIRKAVLQTIKEQQAGADDSNPLDMIKPSPKIEPAPAARPMANNTPKVQANQVILQKKIAIRTGLKRLLNDVNELIIHSGINPDTNNIVRDITKVQDKFESLFGEPVSKEEGEAE